MNRKTVLISLAFCSLVAFGMACVVALSEMTITRRYSVSAAGLEMPQVDPELESWLRAQPGVIGASVSVDRNSNYNLNISLEMSQNLLGSPEFPDVDTKCAQMGYRFKTERFVRNPAD